MRRRPLSLPAKAALALRIVLTFALVRSRLRRSTLPQAVRALSTPSGRYQHLVPACLSRAVDRTLRLGSWQPRCLFSALVLYRLLQKQGDDATLVIGLPAEATSKEAHAWVEIDGRDIGPPPGRGVHVEMARYPAP